MSSPPEWTAGRALRRSMAVVGLVTFVVALVALPARATYGARTTADEPQYLLSALSLGEDLDLDISDELDERRYEPFHEITIDEQTVPLTSDGQRLSPHDPLLPLVLAGPMRIGGWMTAKVALAVIAGVTAALSVAVAVRRFGVGVGIAALVCGAFFVSPPLTAYATQVYPEMPAALAVLGGFWAVTGRLGRRPLAMAVACVVALPWLAVKYVGPAAVLGLALLWRLAEERRRVHDQPPRAGAGRRIASVVGILVVAAIAYLVIHRRVYHGWTVYASGDHFVDGELTVIGTSPDYIGRSRRIVGLLLDRGFGLAAWAPAYLLLPAALGAAWRWRPTTGRLLVAVVAAGWATATWVALTMHGWWWPGRQVVVVLPLVVVAVAALVDRFRFLLAPVIGATALAVFSWLWLVVEASTDRRTLIVDFEDTSNPWYRLWSVLLPDHRRFGAMDIALTVAWLGLIGVTTVALLKRKEPERSTDRRAVSPGAGP